MISSLWVNRRRFGAALSAGRGLAPTMSTIAEAVRSIDALLEKLMCLEGNGDRLEHWQRYVGRRHADAR
jgi:hypothetical protein